MSKCRKCSAPLTCAHCNRSKAIKLGLRASRTGERLESVLALHAAGHSFSQIAEIVGISKSSAHRMAGKPE